MATKGIETLAVVLAAGQGTRMRSALPKVLHAVAGRSMIGHVLAAVKDSVANRAAVVVGPDRDDVARESRAIFPDASVHVQTERLGTAHAVLHAREAIAQGFNAVVVLYADTPLVRPETIEKLRDAIANGAAVAALGFDAKDPTGYGRFVMEGSTLTAIREHKDATEAERRITLCNAGLMALNGKVALDILGAIGNSNAQKEFYLTDAVEIARQKGLKTVAVTASEEEVMGVDDRVKLSVAEGIMQNRLREQAMRNGVTLVDPSTVFFSYDTKISNDVIVEPNVFFGTGVTIEAGAVIHASCHIEGATIGSNVHVGPFARLRPGTVLAAQSKVGNFCEVKAAHVGEGAKINHLTYIGDAEIGAKANIGAGTITCNYDGYFKYKTVIGKGAFIGSNSSLVAPVTIADGSYVGSGSVVTKDVPASALALTRAPQVIKEGWAGRFHQAMAAKKAQKPKKPSET
jgi:bifunctional UDP-N-acetylglucosamine pyrophosphorylase / glucosamine-1-phosphate N-acetyltransferase